MAGWPYPSGSDVAFTIVQDRVASLWRVPRSEPVPFRVTNPGLDAVGPEFIPPPGDDAQWIGPRAVLTYRAPLDTAMHVWAVDLERGATGDLGPGEWPVPLAGGDVRWRRSAARDGSCAVRVAAPGGH